MLEAREFMAEASGIHGQGLPCMDRTSGGFPLNDAEHHVWVR